MIAGCNEGVAFWVAIICLFRLVCCLWERTYTVPNCQDDHLSQQGFILNLRCSSDVNLDMSIWTMSNDPFIRFRCSSYDINGPPGMETWPFVKYSLHPSCQRYPSGPSQTYIICSFQASFMARCTSARIKTDRINISSTQDADQVWIWVSTPPPYWGCIGRAAGGSGLHGGGVCTMQGGGVLGPPSPN